MAAAGTNSEQIATTAFVRGEVSALVAGAPSQLDTLSELSAALGNDANFAATTAAQIGLKAPLASPSFTGSVSAGSFGIPSTWSVYPLGAGPESVDMTTGTVGGAQLPLNMWCPVQARVSLTVMGQNVVLANNAALTDQRTPLDASVTDAKIGGTLSQSKITGLEGALASKAPLASPTFSGNVTASNAFLASAFAIPDRWSIYEFNDGIDMGTTALPNGGPQRTFNLWCPVDARVSLKVFGQNVATVNSPSFQGNVSVAGVLTAQNHSATAYLASGFAVANNTRVEVKFDLAMDTRGTSTFNTSTQRFVAPSAGLYLFVLTVTSPSLNASNWELYLVKNRNPAAFNPGTTIGYISSSATLTATVLLAASDFVEVDVYHQQSSSLTLTSGTTTGTKCSCTLLC